MPAWPKWLRDIAVAVDELLQAGAWVRQRFNEMVKQADKAPTGDLLQTRGVVLAPRQLLRALRQEEKYVRLATIHDEVCEDARPINPYGKNEPLVRRKRAQPRLLYAIRMSEVQCLEDDDRPVLERALADVASELGLRNPLQGVGGAPSIVLESARQTTRPEKPLKWAKRTEPTGERLRIDEADRLAYWNEKRLQINSQADFDVLKTLLSAGAMALHANLLRAIKPDKIADTVEALRTAPSEVKEAISHIRKALRTLGCPYVIETVKKYGYRLRSPDE